jgi:hypothetical protein
MKNKCTQQLGMNQSHIQDMKLIGEMALAPRYAD